MFAVPWPAMSTTLTVGRDRSTAAAATVLDAPLTARLSPLEPSFAPPTTEIVSPALSALAKVTITKSASQAALVPGSWLTAVSRAGTPLISRMSRIAFASSSTSCSGRGHRLRRCR